MFTLIKKNWLGFLFSILIAQAIGIMSSMLSGDIKEKYHMYNLPALVPPDWLFGVVWPILYVMMGFAAYLFYITAFEYNQRRKGMMLYAVQLLLNFSWSIVFFGYDQIWLALVIIIALVITVAYMIMVFERQNKTAAYIMMPYLAWLLFATYLNIGVVVLN